MSDAPNDFQLKVAKEVIETKKKIYKEEIVSLVSAIAFSLSGCAAIMLPMSVFTFINIYISLKCFRNFKPIVKNQYYLHQKLKFLANAKDEKVWTPQDN